MSMVKKSLAAAVLLGAVAAPVSSNAQVAEVGLFGLGTAGTVAAVVASIVLLSVVVEAASDDGAS
jgi:hypothetical protein